MSIRRKVKIKMLPISGKLEIHPTYRCNLGCIGCSRESFLSNPHTDDMTIEDLIECFRQADEIGWRKMPGPGNGSEKPRVLILGGEPTLHPDFIQFVDLARDWSDTYVQVYSNGYTARSRELLEIAEQHGASIARESFKSQRIVTGQENGQNWSMTTCVSPVDAGIESPGKCYAHCSEICGISVDHDGYSPCTIGNTASKILGLGASTKNLADLWEEDKLAEMTRKQCLHCGWNITGRYGKAEDIEKFNQYALTCERWTGGTLVSPTWKKALEGLK